MVGKLADETAEVPTFEVKSLDLNDAGLTFNLKGVTAQGWDGQTPVSYTYDGTTKSVDVDIYKAGTSADVQEYTLVKDEDFTIGGSYKRAGVGEYYVQVMGKGNYTGVYTNDEDKDDLKWTLAALDYNDFAELVIPDDENDPQQEGTATVTYNGEKLAANVEFKDETEAEGADAYKAAADVKLSIKNVIGEELKDAPVNADQYIVEAVIKADGYETQTFTKYVTIAQRDVSTDMTKTVLYGTKFDETLSAEDLNSFDNILPADMALLKDAVITSEFTEYMTGQKELDYYFDFDATAEKVGEEAARNIEIAFNNYNWEFEVKTTPKSINSDDIEIRISKTAVLNEEDFTFPAGTVKVYDKALADENNPEGKLLVEGTDYELNIDSTATPGVYQVEVVGLPDNYKGAKSVEYTAVVAEDIKPEIAAFQSYDGESRVNFVTNFGYIEDDDVTYGVVTYRDAALDGELTTETEGAVVNECDYPISIFRVKDIGSSIIARPYIVVNGEKVYGDQITVNYDELVAQEAVDGPHSEIVVSEKYDEEGRIQFCASFVCKEGEDVQYGVLTCRDELADGELLTLDSEKAVNNEADYMYTIFRLKDIGNGTTVRTYMVVDGEVIYGEQVQVNYADL